MEVTSHILTSLQPTEFPLIYNTKQLQLDSVILFVTHFRWNAPTRPLPIKKKSKNFAEKFERRKSKQLTTIVMRVNLSLDKTIALQDSQSKPQAQRKAQKNARIKTKYNKNLPFQLRTRSVESSLQIKHVRTNISTLSHSVVINTVCDMRIDLKILKKKSIFIANKSVTYHV